MSAPADVVIGVDAGTTSVKAVAVDPSGAIIASAGSDPIPTHAPEPGASVQSPLAIWDALSSACRRGAATISPSTRVRALAVAAQSGSVIPIRRRTILDGSAEDGATEAVTWMDNRSQPLVEAWGATIAETIRSQSGWMPSPGLGLSTISWLRATAAVECDHWASVDDYLMHKLTGSWLTNPSNAAGMQFMDVSSLEWSAELCEIAGIALSTLSIIRGSGERGGTLNISSARTTELPDSLPVVVGGHDQACAALGLGVTAPGSAFLSMGTAWVLTMITDRAEMASLPASFNLSPHVIPHRWTVSQNLGGLGAALASELPQTSDALEAALGSQPPSADDPYFLPAIHQTERTGWGELRRPASPHDPVARIRAVMEACAFEARRAVEEAAPTVKVSKLTVVGGGTRSRYLTQQIADTVGVPLTVRADASWPALGAARLAAESLGWSPDVASAMPSITVHPRRSPDDTRERRYAEYRRLMTGARQ